MGQRAACIHWNCCDPGFTLVAFFASAWTTHSAREAQTVLLESLRPIIVIERAKPEAPPCEEANQLGGMLEEITEEVFEPPPPPAIGDCFMGKTAQTEITSILIRQPIQTLATLAVCHPDRTEQWYDRC